MNPKYLRCQCGWITTRQKDKVLPAECEACGEIAAVESYMSVAELVATIVEYRSQRVYAHAENHGLMVWKKSASRYMIFRVNGSMTVTYRDGAARSHLNLEPVSEKAMNWKDAMQYVRKHTPDLPEYLTR